MHETVGWAWKQRQKYGDSHYEYLKYSKQHLVPFPNYGRTKCGILIPDDCADMNDGKWLKKCQRCLGLRLSPPI